MENPAPPLSSLSSLFFLSVLLLPSVILPAWFFLFFLFPLFPSFTFFLLLLSSFILPLNFSLLIFCLSNLFLSHLVLSHLSLAFSNDFLPSLSFLSLFFFLSLSFCFSACCNILAPPASPPLWLTHPPLVSLAGGRTHHAAHPLDAPGEHPLQEVHR